MPTLDVELIRALTDNYIYLLTQPDSDAVGLVDVGDAVPALAALERRGLTPTHIFSTHHHDDHSGGNGAVKARYPTAKIVAAKSEMARIPGIDIAVSEGDVVPFGTISFKIIEVPGHTRGHIALWSADGNAVFSGDTLFALGCGRLFEGTPAQMVHSLAKLAVLPPQTRLFCGHEYTQSNARFAVTVDPKNGELEQRAKEIDMLRAAGQPTVPSTMALELRTNPFLRASDPAIAQTVGLSGADPVAVFAEIRRRKDSF